jgi:alcohol dehydrogenase, propanol-preferring
MAKELMRAAVLPSPGAPLEIREIALPQLQPGHTLLRVLACGVCRTDLHIVDGELPPRLPHVVPGHQIVGEVVESDSKQVEKGARVGVSWLGGTDESCWYCRHGLENLCDNPTFTGYTVPGGYAEYALVRSGFALPPPADLTDLAAAPLLCRDYRVPEPASSGSKER